MDKSLLLTLLTTEDLYVSLIPMMEGVTLQNGDWPVVTWVKQFRSEKRRLPTKDELSVRFSSFPARKNLEDSFAREEILRYVQEDTMRRWVLGVAEKIDRGTVNYSQVVDEVKKLGEKFQVKTWDGSQVDKRYKEVVEVVSMPEMQERMSTGLKGLDRVLGGGYGRGEIVVLIAPPGMGKTMFLLNAMYSALVQRKNVLFLTLELSEDRFLERFYRRVAEVTRQQMRQDKAKVLDSIGRFFKYMKATGIVLFKARGAWGVEDLGLYLERLKGMGTKIDLVVIDYLDKIRVGRGELRVALGDMTEDLRYMSMEQQVGIVTATQANRASLTSMVVTTEHVGESFRKVEVADVVLSLSRNHKEEDKGQGRLVMLKNRESGGVGVIIPVRIAFDTSLISDL